MKLPIAATLGVLFYLPSANALEFKSYVNERGETVFTNLPSACIKNSRLACMQYHPLMVNKQPLPDAPPNTAKANAAKNTAQSPARPTDNGAKPDISKSALLGLRAVKGLKQLVEANKILDQHFPAGSIGGNSARY